MTFTLDQLSNAFKKPAATTSFTNMFPFWTMDVGDTTQIRFIADPDDTNPLGFLKEKFTHRFNIDGKYTTVPCLQQYGERCPICDESTAFYAAEGKKSQRGKSLYRSRQYLAQAIIIDTNLTVNDEPAVGKLFTFALGFQLFSVIQSAFESNDFDTAPFEVKNGTNFIIKKTKSGEHFKYDIGSKFIRKESDLTVEQLKTIENAVSLTSLLPTQPKVEMLQAYLSQAGFGLNK